MPEIVPIRENNAISEIAFVVFFQKDLGTRSLAALRELGKTWNKSLPESDIISSVKFTIDESRSIRSSDMEEDGFEFFKISDVEEDRREWIFRVQSNNITVICSEYTEWSHIWPAAFEYLAAAIAEVDLKENPVIEIVYNCVDRFVIVDFDGNTEPPNPEDVFSKDNPYLSPYIMEEYPLTWHVHQGWFDNRLLPDASALVNLNISAQVVTKNATHQTIVNHLVKVRRKDNNHVNDKEYLLGTGDSDGYLNEAITNAHRSNKAIFGQLLTSDMQNRIGLLAGE